MAKGISRWLKLQDVSIQHASEPTELVPPMKENGSSCFQCESKDTNDLTELFGYVICHSCAKKLGLLTDKTIQRHVSDFEKSRALQPDHPSYEEEIRRRLDYINKDYISKRIKLLHVLERLGNFR